MNGADHSAQNPVGFPDFYRPSVLAERRFGMAIESEWWILRGYQLTLVGLADGLPAGASQTVINRTVPDGRVLYITSIVFMSRGPDFPPAMYHVYNGGILYTAAATSSGQPTVTPFFISPFRFDAGDVTRVIVWNEGTVTADFYIVLHGYEAPV